ncbi:MAG: hypothetical protein KVP17_003145 [Porospora cf. gigantea B]|uniref:uncharacterized protein n=2 Tax=Porospora cf. gigantea B TaxID=2853592 RepID=UPI003571DFD3|nr:MAG: hypothetical protein KVP17_003145 [Porospora cf. gigantea B]
MSIRSVAFNKPNSIGYVRIGLLVSGSVFAGNNWPAFVVCYLTSQVLDIADGVVARMFNECTEFGAVFDQIIDRHSTIFLYLAIVSRWPSLLLGVVAFAYLDIGGHWIHTLASARTGTYHKDVPAEWNVLRWYYAKRWGMGLCHVSYEVFFTSLYVLSLVEGKQLTAVVKGLMVLSSPFMLLKTYTNVLQGLWGCLRLIQEDVGKQQ